MWHPTDAALSSPHVASSRRLPNASRKRRPICPLFATCEVPMAQPHTLTVKPSELPLRVVLVLPDGTAGGRAVAYVLRHTRAGGLLLNKDDLAPRADKAA